ncbi:thiamine phosphate synthase [bacterium SCSIO 12643]|nr:thiamine phosphate synthase [bacterium SCSIO 12643]
MLIVVTSEHHIPNETNWINQMFQNGLKYLHLRKPGYSMEAYQDLIEQIESQYHRKIMIHEYHELCIQYGLRGIHIPDRTKSEIADFDQYVNTYYAQDFVVSSSFHDVTSIQTFQTHLDYYILSPVFDSISKNGYSGKQFNVHRQDRLIVGLGGIHPDNIAQTLKLGYDGVAVLGSIWQATNPLQSFQNIQKQYQTALT